jgi:hypothetical protein
MLTSVLFVIHSADVCSSLHFPADPPRMISQRIPKSPHGFDAPYLITHVDFEYIGIDG